MTHAQRFRIALLVPTAALTASLGTYGLLFSLRSAPSNTTTGLAVLSVLFLIIAALCVAILVLTSRRRRNAPKQLVIEPGRIRLGITGTRTFDLDWDRPGSQAILIRSRDSSAPDGYHYAMRIPKFGPVSITREAYEAVLEAVASTQSQLTSVQLKPVLGMQRLLIRAKTAPLAE